MGANIEERAPSFRRWAKAMLRINQNTSAAGAMSYYTDGRLLHGRAGTRRAMAGRSGQAVRPDRHGAERGVGRAVQ